MSALRVLAAMFDIDTAKATENLKKLDTGISVAKGALTTLAGSVIGAFSIGAIKHFVDEQIELGSAINDTAEKLGVSTQELQKFQFAAGLSGVSAEGAGQALGFLNKNMGEALGGSKEAVQTFAEMGIALKDGQGNVRELGDVIPELADAFAEMGSDQERTTNAMKIFGKSGAQLLPLLKQGRKELEKLGQEFDDLGGGLQEDFIKLADEAGDEIDKFKFAMTGLKSRIAVEVLPAITEFAKWLQKGIVYVIKLTKETHIVKEGLALLGIVGAAASMKVVAGWAKFFGLFPKGNQGIVKMLASMGWIGLIIAAVALLALVFEDLFVGIEGGESVIRNWLNETLGVEDTNQLFDNLKTIVDQITGSFQNMSPAVSELVKSLAEMAVSPAFVATLEYCVRLIGSLVALLLGAARLAGNLAILDFEGAGKAVDQAGDAVFGKKGFFGEDAWKPYASPGKVRQPVGMERNGQPVDVNQSNQTTIIVNGAGDPAATGREVASAQRGVFSDEKRQALAALMTGPPGADE